MTLRMLAIRHELHVAAEKWHDTRVKGDTLTLVISDLRIQLPNSRIEEISEDEEREELPKH